MISCGVCLYFSDLLHLVWSFLGPSMLLQMLLFHSVLWLHNIYIYIYTHTHIYIYMYTYAACIYISISPIFFIHSSVDGRLGCFHALAIVNSTAMNIGGTYQYLFELQFCPDVCPEVGLQNHMASLISFLRNLHTVLHSGHASLRSHQHSRRASFSDSDF